MNIAIVDDDSVAKLIERYIRKKNIGKKTREIFSFHVGKNVCSTIEIINPIKIAVGNSDIIHFNCSSSKNLCVGNKFVKNSRSILNKSANNTR